VWLALGEHPGTTTLVGGAIVLGAVVIQTIGEPEEPSVPPP
jgi:drug/metabolite transporter (DMT)-like permease